MNDSKSKQSETEVKQLKPLTLKDLNITELERRLELAATVAQYICSLHKGQD